MKATKQAQATSAVGTNQRIDREAVKVLAIAVGCREAARRLNLNENTVISWSNRDKWFPKDGTIQSPAKTGTPRIQSAIKPSDALANVLRERSDKTKLHLSKYVLDASKKAAASKGELKHAKAVKEVAGTGSLIHSWQEKEQGSGPLNLNLLGGRALIQINQGKE